MAKFARVIHMATRRPAHNTPIHMGFLVWSSLERHQVRVDRRVVGWSAGRHVDHPCPRDPDIVNLLSVVNLLRVVIRFTTENVVNHYVLY